MLCVNQMLDLEMEQQGQGYLYPGPSINLGRTPNFQQPNIRTLETASRSSTNFDTPYLPERYDNTLFYGTTQYNGPQHHHHNLDLSIATPGNFYYSFMPPSSSGGVLPVPNHGASDQRPSSSNYGAVAMCADEHGRNNHFIDGARGPCKRKVPEGVYGNYLHFNAPATPSPPVPPLNARHPGGVAVPDPPSFPLPQYMGNGIPPIMEVGPQNGLRNRLVAAGMDSAVRHDHNHLAQGNYVGQHFQPSGIWLEQHLNSNPGDGGAPAWNQAPNLSFMHGKSFVLLNFAFLVESSCTCRSHFDVNFSQLFGN